MTKITETEYNAWKLATFGSEYMIWHEGLPVEAVTPLSGDARSHAIRMLLFGVQLEDGHAATALAAMGETSALSALRGALPTATEDNKIRTAQAINALSGGEDSSVMAKELVSVLEDQNLHWGTKMNAAIGLRDFDDRESEEALLRAVEAENDYLVKYHASSSLLVRWKVKASSISSYPEIFSLLSEAPGQGVMQNKAERGAEAARLLKQLKARVEQSRI
jgi:hypothetical protein